VGKAGLEERRAAVQVAEPFFGSLQRQYQGYGAAWTARGDCVSRVTLAVVAMVLNARGTSAVGPLRAYAAAVPQSCQ